MLRRMDRLLARRAGSSLAAQLASLRNMSIPVDVSEAMKAPDGEADFENTFDYGKVLWETMDRTCISVTLPNSQGALMKVLQIFNQNNVESLRVQSRPVRQIKNNERFFEFELDFCGRSSDPNVKAALDATKALAKNVEEKEGTLVPWFPRKTEDLDMIGSNISREGEGIDEIDHPSFRDADYVRRRWEIGRASLGYKMSDKEIPRIAYTEND